MKPFPGLIAHYDLIGAPLGALNPASRHVNLEIKGGTLSSRGAIEYSPRITRIDVAYVLIDGVDGSYFHLPQTRTTETRRVRQTGKAIKEQNNRPAESIDVNKLEVRHSRLTFDDKVANPQYQLFLDDTHVTLLNFNNHARNGLSYVDVTGRFMGTGPAQISGHFLAGGSGPQFDARIKMVNTNLTSLNPLFRGHGRFDVAQGTLSVYAQLSVKNDNLSGYVKPLFSNVKVYSRNKDKPKGFVQQGKEIVLGAAAHIFKNPTTQKVATQFNLTGKLTRPDVSPWQAFVEGIRNAFIQAILPGFDRQVDSRAAP